MSFPWTQTPHRCHGFPYEFIQDFNTRRYNWVHSFCISRLFLMGKKELRLSYVVSLGGKEWRHWIQQDWWLLLQRSGTKVCKVEWISYTTCSCCLLGYNEIYHIAGNIWGYWWGDSHSSSVSTAHKNKTYKDLPHTDAKQPEPETFNPHKFGHFGADSWNCTPPRNI